MDISKDGQYLLVASYAGFAALYDLNADSLAVHQIGTGSQAELYRWLFWKDEIPMRW